MMSIHDFKEKQVLIVNSSEASDDKLQFKNENLCLVRDGEFLNQISCHKLICVFIVGEITITSKLIANCKEFGVSLFLLKHNFKMYASLVSVAEGNYLLREKQYTCKTEFLIARHLVENKLVNQKILTNKESDRDNIKEKIKKRVHDVKSEKELLGIEGEASKVFFGEYYKELGWIRRSPRTKFDSTNLLLDIGYTVLFNFVDAILGIYGFDIYKGVYHKLFFQRKSLVCDLVEPFRCIIDKQLIKSYNLKQINDEDFSVHRGVYLLEYAKQKKYVEIFTQAILEKKEEIYGYIQNYYYCILNDDINYPVFYIK